MALVIRCDRCKNVYEKNKKTVDGCLAAGISLVSADKYTIEKFDVCDECLCEFLKFMGIEKRLMDKA